MPGHWFDTWLPRAASRPRLHLVRRLKAVPPDRWFLIGFVLLFGVFFLVLVVQPSSVGRRQVTPALQCLAAPSPPRRLA